ncbi:hypothetical protein SDC9_137527 [bioreactor metagenome]|uniref:Uncharacterized protein n=1 Tax=bioreactor metagenome TaxID=1076179 RepID=A0A645DM51_9ZZZZ
MIARLGNILHRVGHRRRAAGQGQRADAPLQGRDALFKHVGGGVHDPGVNIARLRKGKAARGGSGGGKHIGAGLINGHRPGVRGGVGALLPNVKLKGFKLIFSLFCHVNHTFCLYSCRLKPGCPRRHTDHE